MGKYDHPANVQSNVEKLKAEILKISKAIKPKRP